jgi:hypothetical protein
LDTDAATGFTGDPPAAGSVVIVGQEPLHVDAGELRQSPHLGMGHVQILAENTIRLSARGAARAQRGRDQREIAQRDATDFRFARHPR